MAQLQFKRVSVLELLEALVNESNLTVEALRMERDSLKKEVEDFRGKLLLTSSTAMQKEKGETGVMSWFPSWPCSEMWTPVIKFVVVCEGPVA